MLSALNKNLSDKASKDVATTSANGLMSSTDKAKLDGIADGANKTTLNNTLTSTSTAQALTAAKGKVLYDDLKELIKTQSFSKTVSVSQYSATNVSFTITLSGYTPIGIIGFNTANPSVFVNTMKIQNSQATLTLSNANNATESCTAELTVLYAKSLS